MQRDGLTGAESGPNRRITRNAAEKYLCYVAAPPRRGARLRRTHEPRQERDVFVQAILETTPTSLIEFQHPTNLVEDPHQISILIQELEVSERHPACDLGRRADVDYA